MTQSPEHPRLQLSHIAKAFGGIQAVRGVSLDVRRGEVLVPSGRRLQGADLGALAAGGLAAGEVADILLPVLPERLSRGGILLASRCHPRGWQAADDQASVHQAPLRGGV